MSRKKSIRKSVPKSVQGNQSATGVKWKIVKIIVIGILLGFGILFIVRNSKHINLEGSWKATKIVLDGENLLENNILNDFDLANQITISNFGNSMNISTTNKKIEANFSLKKDDKGIYYMILSSRESFLNGNFDMKIDTTHLGPQAYRVYIRLHRNKTFLYFQKEVIIPPWKPEFPKKGQV
nr:hypothetical protein [uncultured Flavobacterium sp.]